MIFIGRAVTISVKTITKVCARSRLTHATSVYRAAVFTSPHTKGPTRTHATRCRRLSIIFIDSAITVAIPAITLQVVGARRTRLARV